MTNKEILQAFSVTKDLSGLKGIYRRLCFQFHPDHGGSDEIMKEINRVYHNILQGIVETAFEDRRQTSGKDGRYYQYSTDDVYNLKTILDIVLNLDGVRVEIIGTWVYVFEARPYKDFLKGQGLWFSVKHKAWVYSGVGKRFVRSRYSTDEIRAKYGYEVLQSDKKERIA